MSRLMTHLNKIKYDINIVVFNHSPYGDLINKLKLLNVSIHEVPTSKRTIMKRLWYLLWLIRKINPDVIHSWTLHDNAYAGVIGILLNIPSIGSVRGSLYGTGFSKISNLFKWSSIFLVDNLLVNTLSIKYELIEKGVEEERISLIYNGIEINDNVISDRDDKKIIICTIGNLRKNKNHETFLKTVRLVANKIPNIHGWIIGQPVNDEPEQKIFLEKMICELSLTKHVELLGFQSDTKKFLKKASIFLLPSWSEGHPNSILEAMSVGTPVIASNVGGISETIKNGLNGFILEPNDVRGFARKIIQLTDDEENKKSIIDNSLKILKRKYKIQNKVKELEKIYDSI